MTLVVRAAQSLEDTTAAQLSNFASVPFIVALHRKALKGVNLLDIRNRMLYTLPEHTLDTVFKRRYGRTIPQHRSTCAVG